MKNKSSGLSENGFTLSEMMITLGIGSIIMSAIVGGLAFTIRQRQMLDQKTETSLLTDRINAVVAKPAKCGTSLNNTVIDTAAGVQVTIDGVTENQYIGQGVKVSTLKLVVDQAHKTPLPSATVGSFRYPAYLQLQTVTTNGASSIYSRQRNIPLHVDVDVTNQVYACSGETGEQLVCAKGGGVWDASAPDGLRCAPAKHCLFGGTYSTLPVADGGFINPTTGAQSCLPGYKVQQAGSLSLAMKSGKYGAKNTTYPNYNCVRCGSGAGTVAAAAQGAYDDGAVFEELNAEAEAANEMQIQQTSDLEAIRLSLGITW